MLRFMTCVMLSGLVIASAADQSYCQTNSGSAGGNLNARAGANATQGTAQGQAAATGRARNPAGGDGSALTGPRRDWNPYSINQTPWFNRDAVRRELSLNNDQYNRMNDAYSQTYDRYRNGRATRGTEAGDSFAEQTAERERARADQVEAQQAERAQQGQRTPQARRYNERSAPAGQNGSQGYLPGRDPYNEQRLRYDRFARDYSRATAGTLDEMQMERYNQLQLQRQGINAFRSPSLQQELNLTDKQKGELEELYSTYHKAMWEYGNDYGDLDQSEAGERFKQIRTNTQRRLTQILDEEQNRQWSELTGEPFEFGPEDFNYRAPFGRELSGEGSQRVPY